MEIVHFEPENRKKGFKFKPESISLNQHALRRTHQHSPHSAYTERRPQSAYSTIYLYFHCCVHHSYILPDFFNTM